MHAAKRIVCQAVLICLTVAVVSFAQDPTTNAPYDACAIINATKCSDCVDLNAKCLWCPNATPRCRLYESKKVLPTNIPNCPLTEARWLNCTVNFQVLLIMMGVIAGVILISAMTCFYCCCCRTSAASHSRRERRDEERARRDKEARQARHSEKKAERQAKYEDIRRKYGAGGGGATSPYSKFDNEPEA